MWDSWFGLVRRHIILTIAVVVHAASLGGIVYARQVAEPSSSQNPVTLPSESEFPTPSISGIPTNVSIVSLGIDLPILPGAYDSASDSWTLTGNKAHFATITRPANNGGGNTFVYGHNNKDVFGPLRRIQPGTEVVIKTDIGNTFYYTLDGIKTTDPSDVSLFTYTGTPMLTIQTCTGVWHERRQLYTFRLIHYEESGQSVAIRGEEQRQRIVNAVSNAGKPTFKLADVQTSEPEQSRTPPKLSGNTSKSVPHFDINILSQLILPERPLMYEFDTNIIP